MLTIDLGALAENWRELARRAAPGRCAAVIKADAYGVGIEAAAPALHAAGCRVFFVAHASEGARARAVLPPDARIYVLNGLESEADPAADYRGAKPRARDRQPRGTRAVGGRSRQAGARRPRRCISTPA